MIEDENEDFVPVSALVDEKLDQFENKLRPISLQEYVGQDEIKKSLGVATAAAKMRGEGLDHVLLYGPPGLGKTTLAHIIASELGSSIKITSGPALEKPGDLAAIISNLQVNDVLFIDEIHRLKPVVEEVLYTAMEDFGIDIVIGKGPSARNMRINLPKFTLIGATTKLNMLSAPLRSRFGHVFKLNFYSDDDIQRILLRSAQLFGCAIDDVFALRLARCCRKTPRVANRLLKIVRDYAEVRNFGVINEGILDEALEAVGVDELGLDNVDRELISVIIDKFDGGPVGLGTISAAISEERATIEDIYEPYLIQIGFLERTPRGRIVKPKAFSHMRSKMSNKLR